MIGRKSRKIREQTAYIDDLLDQLAAVKEDSRDHLGAAVRTAQRNTRLLEQLDEHRPAADFEAESAYARQLERRLIRALRAAGRYLTALWAARATNARLRQLLKLTDRPHRELAEQILQLQDANEAMCREAMGRVGMLAKPEAVSKR